MFNVTIYTDGSCSSNPGVGGYGAIITCKGTEKIVRGNCTKLTTNNRMELTAVIEALKILKKPCEITVFTDAEYIVKNSAHTKEWFYREDRKNRDLWIELITVGLDGKHKIKFVKVQGHAGNVMNERCDKIAKEQCVKARHEMYGGRKHA